MADKRVGKHRRKGDEDNDKPCTKEETAVAKHIRFNCPTRDAKFVPLQSEVKTFIAKDAVDLLLDSKWAKTTTGEIQFTDRKSCERFMDKLLRKGLFHRALKVERKKKKRRDEGSETDKKKKKSKKVEEESEKEKTDEKKEGEEEKVKETKDKKSKDDKKKKEKKIKVDMHEEQIFIDGDDVYVWVFDPVPPKTFIIGLLMVLGAAALCVFPLWPDELRVGVYYCSLAGASFVGFILFLVVFRFIVFMMMWTATIGKLHFWFLPNLTEDVGFFDSFKPLYTYDFPNKEKEEEEKRKKLEKKRKRREREKQLREQEEEEERETGFEVVHAEDVQEKGDDEDDPQVEERTDVDKEDDSNGQDKDESTADDNGENEEEGDEEEEEEDEKKIDRSEKS